MIKTGRGAAWISTALVLAWLVPVLLLRPVFEYIQPVSLIFVAIACARWGEQPERLLAAVMLTATALDLLFHQVFDNAIAFATVDRFHFLLDLLMLCAMLPITIQANRLYPLWITACQLISITGHISRAMSLSISPWAYAIIYAAPSYMQIAALIGGVFLHRHRVRTNGPYPSWSDLSDPSLAKDRGK